MYLSMGFKEIGRGGQGECFGGRPGDRERGRASVDPRQASSTSAEKPVRTTVSGLTPERAFPQDGHRHICTVEFRKRLTHGVQQESHVEFIF